MKLFFTIVVGMIGVTSIIGGMYFLNKYVHTPSVVHTADIANFKNDNELVGASHDVFVGKVLSKTKTISIGDTFPGTVFQVEVIDVIKGDKTGIIDLIQVGGCLNGKCIVMSGDIVNDNMPVESIDEILLKTGETYLLFTRSDEKYSNILIPNIAGKIYLPSSTPKGIQNSSRYKDIEKAYTEEIVFEGDIKLGWDKSAFSKLSTEKKQKILERISLKK